MLRRHQGQGVTVVCGLEVSRYRVVGIALVERQNCTSSRTAESAFSIRDEWIGHTETDMAVGPLRIEYGHKLDRRVGESQGELFFSIGSAF